MSASPVSDAQLIARVLVHDDRHAFGELVRRHQSTVRACLRKLTAGNAALADDLFQETFLLAGYRITLFELAGIVALFGAVAWSPVLYALRSD